MLKVIVDHGRQQVIGFANRIHVPYKMQVDILGRHNLGCTGSRSSAFNTEVRSQGWLPEANNRFVSQ